MEQGTNERVCLENSGWMGSDSVSLVELEAGMQGGLVNQKTILIQRTCTEWTGICNAIVLQLETQV